jgi:hypothetical protein
MLLEFLSTSLSAQICIMSGLDDLYDAGNLVTYVHGVIRAVQLEDVTVDLASALTTKRAPCLADFLGGTKIFFSKSIFASGWALQVTNKGADRHVPCLTPYWQKLVPWLV